MSNKSPTPDNSNTADTLIGTPTAPISIPTQPQVPDAIDDLVDANTAKLIDKAAEAKEKQGTLEDQLNNQIQELENNVETQQITNEQLEGLFTLVDLLPPTEAETRKLTVKLMLLLNKLNQKNPDLAKVFITLFGKFLSANPTLGFNLIRGFKENKFGTPIDATLMRDLMVEFLQGINDSSVALEASITQNVATLFFDLLNTNWGTDINVILVLLSSLHTSYLSTLPLAQAHDHQRRLTLLNSTLTRLDQLNNEALVNSFIEIIQKFLPEEATELINSRNEVSAAIETLKDVDQDQKTRIDAFNKLMDLIFSKDNLNESEKRQYTEVLRVVIDMYSHSDFADVSEISQGSLGRTMLNSILRLKSELQTPASALATNFDGTLFLNQIDTKIRVTFEMVNGRHLLGDGIAQFYNVFLDNPDNYRTLGSELRFNLMDSVTGSITNSNLAINLLLKLDAFLNDIDGQAAADILNTKGNWDKVKDSENDLEGNLYGEFLIFFIRKPEADLVILAERFTNENELIDILALIYLVRPEIQGLVEQKTEERKTEQLNAVTAPVVEASKAITDAQNLDATTLKSAEVEKQEADLNKAIKILHKAPLGVGDYFRANWLKKIDSNVANKAEQSKEQQIASAFEQGVNVLEQLFTINSRQNTVTLMIAVVNPEFKQTFDSLLVNIADCSNPNLIKRIYRILGRICANPELVETLPPQLIDKAASIWMGKVEKYNGGIEGDEFKEKTNEYQGVEEGVLYRLAPLRRWSKKDKAESSLAELYESINLPRNSIVKDMVKLWNSPELFKVYIQNPAFTKMLRSLVETMLATDRKNLTETEKLFLKTFFSTVENKEQWAMIPADIRRFPAELLIRNSLNSGTPDYLEFITQTIEVHQPAPPPYESSEIADYFAASYFYLVDNNTELRAKVQELEKNLTVIESASSKKGILGRGFRRGLTPDEKRLEESLSAEQKQALVQFRLFNDYFSFFASTPGARSMVIMVENETKDSKRSVEASVLESTLLTTSITAIDAIQLPPTNQLFLSRQPESKVLLDKYVTEVIKFVDGSKLLTPPIPPFILGNMEVEDSSIEKIFKDVATAYYYELYSNGNKDTTGKNENPNLIKLRKYVGGLLANLNRFGYTSLYDKLTMQMRAIENDLNPRVQTTFNNVNQDVSNLESAVNTIDINFASAKESIDQINLISRTPASRRVLSTQLVLLQDSLKGTDGEVKVLLAKFTEQKDSPDQKSLENLLGNLYYLMFMFRRYKPIVLQIEALISKIVANLGKNKIKGDSIIAAAKPRLEDAKVNKRNGNIIVVTTADLQTRLDNTEKLIKQIA